MSCNKCVRENIYNMLPIKGAYLFMFVFLSFFTGSLRYMLLQHIRPVNLLKPQNSLTECDCVRWCGLCMTDVWWLKWQVGVHGAWETSYDAMVTFSPLSRISDPVARLLLGAMLHNRRNWFNLCVQMSDNKAHVGGEMVAVGSKKLLCPTMPLRSYIQWLKKPFQCLAVLTC